MVNVNEKRNPEQNQKSKIKNQNDNSEAISYQLSAISLHISDER